MGEAKRRHQAKKQLKEALDRADLPRLSAALQKLTTAASGNHGADCYIHAAIAQRILSDLGVETQIVAGYAAWRVGNGDSDVIQHAPSPGMIPQPGGVPYHVWLETGDFILDFTTYALVKKAAQLDKLDGGHTTVSWHPDYLLASKHSISSIRDVTQKNAGMYYYERVAELERTIIETAPELDQDDLDTAWILYKNPEIKVLGPNDIR